jgi:aryl-alcohol dehydrogenase-like predicted oxidoreductase
VTEKDLIMGTYRNFFHGDNSEAKRMLLRFTECGYNKIDTAREYCNGLAESLLYSILGGSVKSYEISSKVFYNPQEYRPYINNSLSLENIKSSLHMSLDNLNVSNLDCLVLHNEDHRTDLANVYQFLAQIYDTGVIKSIGFSRWGAQRLVEFAKLNVKSIPLKLYSIVNPLTPVDDEILAVCSHNSIRWVAHSIFCRGALFKRQAEILDLIRANRGTNLEKFYSNNYNKILEFSSACDSPAKVVSKVLQYLSSIDLIEGVVVGFSSLEQMDIFLSEWRAS